MILTSPADACANPMHGNIAGAPAKALPFPASPSYRTHVRQCIFITSDTGFALNSIAVRIPTPDFSTSVRMY
jgi:hypothetical protein